MRTGTLYIISAPSGAGKTSLVKKLRSSVNDIVVSVSHTTRKQRPGEIHGQDYFFCEQEEFDHLLQDQMFLEHAVVFDHHYGTSSTIVNNALSCGQDVILEIDWQGARQVKKLMPSAVSIFILPPSLASLEKRLCDRGQDSQKIIDRRMQDAIAEISHYTEYDYLIVNDEFDEAYQNLKSIVIAYRLTQKRQVYGLKRLLSDLLGVADND